MLAVALISSCGGEGDDEPKANREGPLGTITQAVDTDTDGLDDGWETTHFGNLAQTASGDFDSDGMTNLEEYTNGFNPTVNDAFADADGDRYPNIFELRRSSDPNSSTSTPTANYTVDITGGGTHTSLSAAYNASSTANGAYQIIAVAPGTYPAAANDLTLQTSKPKLLIIGLQGAAKTIIDGGGTGALGWTVANAAVIASLTFEKWGQAIYVNAGSNEVRLVDLVLRNNGNTSFPGAVHIDSKTSVVGSTFLDNFGGTSYGHLYVNGNTTMLNTVIWGQASGTVMVKTAGATLITNNCLVKGQTLTGTGNLAGSTDPKLRSDGRLLYDSPLRGAGGAVVQSKIDLDGEQRPSSSPDIGADQFVDSDADDLADSWEMTYAGNLTTLTSRTQDGDSDGLSNDAEYVNRVSPTVADTDGDGVSDGDEVTVHTTNPLSTDTDGDDMPDGWEVTYGLSPTVANRFDDNDGDGYANVFEYARGSDPSSSTSKPTPNYTVDITGGGTHTSLNAAYDASNISNGAYQIIGVAPGTYTATANDLTLQTSKPKLLIIGLQGAAKTIIDGVSGTTLGWTVANSAVISSLTFTRWSQAIYVNAGSNEVRLVDLVVRNNGNTLYPGALHLDTKTFVVGSTFLDNFGGTSYGHVYVNGQTTMLNTVVWGQGTATTLIKSGAGTLVTNNCLVKGQTLTGTGNLAGTTDPKLRADGRLLWDSPLRGAGGTVAQSKIDFDGEQRPSSSPDIGADQFVDSDADDLADSWEVAYATNLTTLTSRSQDGDSDGLSNEAEYANSVNPIVADTDGDTLSDGNEVLVHGTNPLNADTDGDDMPDAWEITYGLLATVANRFDDNDGDGYPNVFEYARGSDPSSSTSKPTPNYTVDITGGGTHTSLSAAYNASNISNGAYQIIGVAPGTYTATANDLTLQTSKPKFLIIGLQGAAKTIIDGGGGNAGVLGWTVNNAAVIASLTFQKWGQAMWISAPTHEVRLVDLMVRNNGNTLYPGALHLDTKTFVVGSTFLDNFGGTSYGHVYVNGQTTMLNTVVWGQGTATTLIKSGNGTLVTNNCLVKGQTLTGTGNLAGTVNPKLRSDGRLRSDSPLRGAGGAVAQSKLDIDNELRPTSTPDMGVDQFNDSDSDSLPDAWEVANAGNITTIAGAADDDGDGLTNAQEYDIETSFLDDDSDNDGVEDSDELALGLNPLVADADDVTGDANGDGVMDIIGIQLGHPRDKLDDDGDSVSNADEVLMCTNPFRADTDGDGVPDNTDKFPHDPLMSTLPSNSSDVTAPVITLTAPWYAVLQ